MGRTNLYRGRRIDTKEWVYGDLGQCLDGRRYIFPSSNERQLGVSVIPETVGQYTGLKDKNGVKIFEGDIIQVAGESKYRVEWSGTFGYQGIDSLGTDHYWSQFCCNPTLNEIIGNIHEESQCKDK